MIENEFNLPSIPEILEEKEYKHRTIYDCLLDAVEASGIPSTTLRSWMKGITKKTKNVNLKGWHYLNPEDALTRKQKKKD